METIDSTKADKTKQDGLYVWDMPLRIFHWGLVVAIIVSIASVEFGRMDIHLRAGLTVLGLVAFRLVWGFVGGHHARFRNFIVSPARVVGWLRSSPLSGGKKRQAGHSPIGGMAVLVLLGIVTYMAVSGLFSRDSVVFEGPLAHLVSYAASKQISGWHHQGERVLFGLIALHVVAIIFYRYAKNIKLVRTMITGRSSEPVAKINGPEGRITEARLFAGLAVLAVTQVVAHLLPVLNPSL